MADDAAPTFAAQLKRYRLAANLSQEALAEAAGLSARAIRALERGERTVPHRDTLDLLATAMRLSPEQRQRLDAAVPRQRGPRQATTAENSRPGSILPTALTAFIGREQEIDALQALLAQQAVRLITLTGPGGVGKTRLALQAATTVADRYADGVWFVDLAPLADPLLVPGTIAAAFGVREVSGQPIVTTLAAALRPKRLLLLLDNCEHLVDACARAVDTILRSCPLVQVLATSREAMGIDSEISRQVPSLTVPPADALPPVDQLARYEAVRLFVERARAVQSAFALTAQNARAVGETCRRLDGIPLALELAAAWVRSLSVEQLAERLDQRFRLLTGGNRTAVPRQQTLRAAIDWSYDLLAEPERRLFQRLSVFAGGWTLEAAEHVGAGDGIAQEDVLGLLARLVDQSLVLAEEQPGGTTRYRLLETLRQYGVERLAASGESEALRERHAAYYARLMEVKLLPPDARVDNEAYMRGFGHHWLPRLAPEFDNLRLALEWLVDKQATAHTIPLLVAFGQLLSLRGASGFRHFWRRILEEPSLAEPTKERAAMLLQAGSFAYTMGAYAEARRYHEERVAVLRFLGDFLGVALSLGAIGIMSREEGNLATAQELLGQALAAYRQHGDQPGLASTLIQLGEVVHIRGHDTRAQAYYEEGLRTASRGQYPMAIGRALHHLGALALDQRAPAVARERFIESLAIHRQHHHWRWFHYTLADFAELAAAEGLPERALRLGGAAAALAALGDQIQPSERGRFDRWMARARQGLSEEAAVAAWAEGAALSVEQALDYAAEDG